MKRVVTFILIALALAVVIQRIVLVVTHRNPGAAAAGRQFDQPSSARISRGGVAALTGIRGTAQGVILRRSSDGDRHVDTPRTIERLRTMNANTYQFMIEGPNDWTDFQNDFMPAAQRAGLRVIAYLLPPSECPSSAGRDGTCDTYVPYQADYRAWATAIGKLAARYSDLVAWTIDDMDYSLTTFTPAYVMSLNQAAQHAWPGLNFLMELYQPAITPTLVAQYADGFAGIIMPFRDGMNADTMVTASASGQIDALAAMLKPYHKKLIVMVYANALSIASGTPPDTGYVSALVGESLAKMGTGEITGVITWNLPLGQGGRRAASAQNMAHTGSGALVLTTSMEVHVPRGFAQAAATVTLDPGSTSCVFLVDRRVRPGAQIPAGHQEIEVLLGSHDVWTADLASLGTDWSTSAPVDLISGFTGPTAVLTLRLGVLSDGSGDQATVSIDNLSLTGCSVTNPTFEIDDGWTLTTSGGTVYGGVYQYSRMYSTETLAALAALYALNDQAPTLTAPTMTAPTPVAPIPSDQRERPGTITRRAS